MASIRICDYCGQKVPPCYYTLVTPSDSRIGGEQRDLCSPACVVAYLDAHDSQQVRPQQ